MLKQTHNVEYVPDKWDLRRLRECADKAYWSRDPSTKVFALITRPDKTLVSEGFNGFPRGVKDDPDLYANREEKYPRVVHAEMNALLMGREPLHGCTIYTWPFPPCSTCAGAIIQAGIKRVVAPYPSEDIQHRWGRSNAIALEMFCEVGVKVLLVHDHRLYRRADEDVIS